MKFYSSLLLLLATPSISLAWTTPSASSSTSKSNIAGTGSSSRRVFLDQAAKIVPLVVLASPAFADDDEPAVVVAEEAPAAPAAPEPSTTTGESDLITRLKAQSDAKKVDYKKQAQRSDKLSNGQFSSQYDRSNSLTWTRPYGKN